MNKNAAAYTAFQFSKKHRVFKYVALPQGMAADEVINMSTDIATDLAVKIGSVGKWLQAIGVIIILWVIFQIINWVLNRKRVKRLDLLREDMNRIEKKVDKLLKKPK